MTQLMLPLETRMSKTGVEGEADLEDALVQALVAFLEHELNQEETDAEGKN